MPLPRHSLWRGHHLGGSRPGLPLLRRHAGGCRHNTAHTALPARSDPGPLLSIDVVHRYPHGTIGGAWSVALAWSIAPPRARCNVWDPPKRPSLCCTQQLQAWGAGRPHSCPLCPIMGHPFHAFEHVLHINHTWLPQMFWCELFSAHGKPPADVLPSAWRACCHAHRHACMHPSTTLCPTVAHSLARKKGEVSSVPRLCSRHMHHAMPRFRLWARWQ